MYSRCYFVECGNRSTVHSPPAGLFSIIKSVSRKSILEVELYRNLPDRKCPPDLQSLPLHYSNHPQHPQIPTVHLFSL